MTMQMTLSYLIKSRTTKSNKKNKKSQILIRMT